MKKAKYLVTGLSMILTVSGWLMPFRASAEGEPRKANPLQRHLTSAIESPIGVIETFGSFKVNGQSGFGKGVIWRDDLLQAPADMGARVLLTSFGKVTLERGTIVRFATVESRSSGTLRQDLVVRLIAGNVIVTLQPEVKAYLDTFESSFIAFGGAKFRFGIRESQAFVDADLGEVSRLGNWAVQLPRPIVLAAAHAARVQAQTQGLQTYRIRPIGGVNNSAVYDVRARASRQIQVQVTDENDRKIPDLPIIFTLGSNVGQFGSTTVATNAEGIATINLTASNQPTTGSFTATIQGTNISLVGQIVVLKAVPAFWSFQNAGPVLATAAAAVAAGAITIATRDEPLKIKAVGEPTITP